MCQVKGTQNWQTSMQNELTRGCGRWDYVTRKSEEHRPAIVEKAAETSTRRTEVQRIGMESTSQEGSRDGHESNSVLKGTHGARLMRDQENLHRKHADLKSKLQGHGK